MDIKTKASVGSKIYFLKAIKKHICPLCAGTGKITLGNRIDFNASSTDAFIEQVGEQIAQNIVDIAQGNAKSYTCPECEGKRYVKATGQTKYEVCEGTVIGIDTYAKQNHIRVVYTVFSGNDSMRFDEDYIWPDKTEVEKHCEFLNFERRMLPIECVQIPSCFAETIPHNSKLMKRLDEWRDKKQFDTEIYVNEKFELFDGYTAYLIYKMLGVIDIPVVIIPNKS